MKFDKTAKRFDFQNGKHQYSFYYHDPVKVIGHLMYLKYTNEFDCSREDMSKIITKLHRLNYG